MTPTDPFDPSSLRLNGPLAGATARQTAPRKGVPRPKAGERFLRGPIPWPWVVAAAALPGKALAVGLVLWFEAGCARSRTVRVTLARLRRLGMGESTARRAVKALAGARLVTVAARPGRALEVTIEDAAGPAPADGSNTQEAT